MTLSALFSSSFMTLFVIIDALGCAPIFSSLTKDASAAHRRAMAVRSVGIAAGVLFFFAFFGEDFLDILGVSLDAFRIAGGLMLFFIAVDMVFEFRTKRREERAESVARDAERQGRPLEAEDISVFPMAIPMIAGPGSIASVMLLAAKAHGAAKTAVVMAALGANLLVLVAALLAAGPIMRALGTRIEAMLTRLLGVILAALAVQFVIDGVRGALAT